METELEPESRNNSYTMEKNMNICFCTTHGWNVGDEFILEGVKNIFKKVLKYEHVNFLIYNRHPDIHSIGTQLFRAQKVPTDISDEELLILEANVKIGMFDNSIKPDFDAGCIDLVVFAGTPEWCNGRCYDLYRLILKYNIPTMFLGVGNEAYPCNSAFSEVIQKSKLLTVRDTVALESVRQFYKDPEYIPCPALCSAPERFEKQIQSVKKIALVYQSSIDDTVVWTGASKELYEFEISFYKEIISRYTGTYEIEMVCHYIDEVPAAMRDFPELTCHYSYKADDYFEIYKDFDMIISPRIHGIGCAASLCIPGIAVIHDGRGETCEGFLARTISYTDDLKTCFYIIDDTIKAIEKLNLDLVYHKHSVLRTYTSLVASTIHDLSVVYDNKLPDRSEAEDIFSSEQGKKIMEILKSSFYNQEISKKINLDVSKKIKVKNLGHSFINIIKKFFWMPWATAQSDFRILQEQVFDFQNKMEHHQEQIKHIQLQINNREFILEEILHELKSHFQNYQ